MVGPDAESRADLTSVALRLAPAGSVVVERRARPARLRPAGGPGLRDGRPTAYVCRGFVCRLPVTSGEDLAAQLA